MKPTLQEQLAYLYRTVNPNYIIIVKNKANENMDFSTFKAVIPEKKEEYKPQKRYSIVIKDIIPEDGSEVTQITIIVNDSYCTREAFRGTFNKDREQEAIKSVKKDYRGSEIFDQLKT